MEERIAAHPKVSTCSTLIGHVLRFSTHSACSAKYVVQIVLDAPRVRGAPEGNVPRTGWVLEVGVGRLSFCRLSVVSYSYSVIKMDR